MKLPALRLLGLAVLPALAPPPSDLAADLGMELAHLGEPLAPPPAELVARVAARIGRPPAFLSEVELRRARGRVFSSSPELDVTVGRIDLTEPAGARVVFAVDGDGRLAQAAVRGRPEFDEDPWNAWALFVGQLCSYGALGPPDEFRQRLAAGMDAEQMDAWLAEVATSDEPETELVRALIEQRQRMRGFTVLHRVLVLRGDALPPAEWIAGGRRDMEHVAGLSPLFADLLGGPGAEEHRRLASETGSFLGELEAAARAGEAESFGRLQGKLRRNCARCHSLPSPAGPAWDDFFAMVRSELELPTGVMRVGYDVVPAPGDDGGTSQVVADALRGALLLVDAVGQ